LWWLAFIFRDVISLSLISLWRTLSDWTSYSIAPSQGNATTALYSSLQLCAAHPFQESKYSLVMCELLRASALERQLTLYPDSIVLQHTRLEFPCHFSQSPILNAGVQSGMTRHLFLHLRFRKFLSFYRRATWPCNASIIFLSSFLSQLNCRLSRLFSFCFLSSDAVSLAASVMQSAYSRFWFSIHD
jgi:hypothetical protein